MSVTLTPSDGESLDEVRAGVLRQPGLVGAPLRQALTDGLRRLAAPAVCPAAPRRQCERDGRAGARRGRRARATRTGAVLRSGPGAASRRRRRDIRALADEIWYPIWDSGIGLDHSVRTPDEAVSVAKQDLKAVLGLLDLRHIAGDAGRVGLAA